MNIRGQVGSVNRAAASSAGIGGKGQGAWVATHQLSESRPLGDAGLPPRLVQFLGTGDEGDALAAALRRRCPGSDEALWVRTAGKTRICTTLVSMSSGEATEVVEPSAAVAAGEVASLLGAVEAAAAGEAAGILVMGSMPPGVPADCYGSILKAAAGPRTRVVIDSVAGLGPALAAVAGAGARGLLKLNGRELLGLGGGEVPAGSDNDDPCDGAAAAAAAGRLADALPGGRGALEAVCWTDGPFPGGALDLASGRRFRLALPPLSGPVLSPVGAGDAVAGGTLYAWLASEPSGAAVAAVAASGAGSGAHGAKGGPGTVPVAVQAFAFGLACGAASCLTAENSIFDMKVVMRIHAQITCEEITGAAD